MDDNQLSQDFKNTFSTVSGGKVLNVLKSVCQANWMQNSFNTNPYQTAFNEGARWVFGYIMYQIEKKEAENVSRETCQTEEPTERT